jgi:hypothetical protein
MVMWHRLLIPKALLVLRVHGVDGRHKLSPAARRWLDEHGISSLGAKT